MARSDPPPHEAPPEWFATPAGAEEVDMLRHWVAGLSAELARTRAERDAAQRELARVRAELEALRARLDSAGLAAVVPASAPVELAGGATRSPSPLRRAAAWLRRLGRGAVVLGLLGAGLAGVGGRLLPVQLYVMTSDSMAPSLPSGSLLVVQATSPTAIWPGEIVVFPSPLDGRGTVTHRVVGVTLQADGIVLRTRGDANPAADPWLVPATAVRGKVVAVVPRVGDALLTLQRPWVGRAAAHDHLP
jgi:signal peptidase I